MAKLLIEPLGKKNIPIVEILGGEEDGEIIYLNEDDENYGDEQFKEFKVMPGSTMKWIPKLDGPSFIYLFGKNGSGKSWWTQIYATTFQDCFPDYPVYLVSFVKPEAGGSIDKIRDLIRIPIEDIMDDKANAETLKSSLVIFDDIDGNPPPSDHYKPKDISLKIQKLRDTFLTTGRHLDVSCVCTSHLGADYAKTKTPISESDCVVVFPRGGNHRHIERVLCEYGGVSKTDYKKILALPSRWVMVYKNYPSYVLYEKGLFLL